MFKILAFDADDTLWENEIFFREAEKEFCELFPKIEYNIVLDNLVKTIIRNIELYGYGIKGFTLSMVETAINLENYSENLSLIPTILEIGKQMLNKPVILIDGVLDTLKTLKSRNYKLVLATKGDLFDQHRKLNKSQLSNLFDHVEVMKQKNEEDYLKLISTLRIKKNEFLMIGNSMKSDIIPVLSVGGKAVFIPHPQSWWHENVDSNDIHGEYIEVKSIADLLKILN
jgi:putative hydrolase of the HAD superfamily